MEEAAQLTAELILAADNYMKYDAVNIGAYDLSLGIDFLLYKVSKSESKAVFLSANLYNPHGERLFPATTVKQVGQYKVGILGLIDDELKLDKIPAGRKLIVTDPVKEAQKLLPRLKEQGVNFVVVLTDLKGGSLLKLARSCPSIDLIVASDKRNQISLPIIEGQTYITHLDRGGKCAGRLDVAPSDSRITEDSDITRGQTVGKNIFRNSFIQLRLDIPDHAKVGPMVAEAKKRISVAQKNEMADTPEVADKSGCGTKFVGETACRKCHADRHQTWQLTKHSRAFQALVDKNRQYDPECVMCHSLAYECDKGKLSLGKIEAFNNVQCESCHGPGELHVKSKGEQSMKPLPTVQTCLKCHTPERSGEGGFEYRFDKICVKKKT